MRINAPPLISCSSVGGLNFTSKIKKDNECSGYMSKTHPHITWWWGRIWNVTGAFSKGGSWGGHFSLNLGCGWCVDIRRTNGQESEVHDQIYTCNRFSILFMLYLITPIWYTSLLSVIKMILVSLPIGNAIITRGANSLTYPVQCT